MSTLAIYERLQAKGAIGPRDEQGHMRPWQEFPKAVQDANGTTVIVHSARQELEVRAKVAGEVNAAADADPVIAERNRLARENDELRAQLQMLAAASAGQASPDALKSASLQIPIDPPAMPAGPISPPVPMGTSQPPADGLPAGAKLGSPQVKRMN